MGAASTAKATIDRGALRANLAFARACAGGREVIAVVKADAYGHGAVPVARTLLDAGAHALAVFDAGEVAELRDGGVDAPLLAFAGPVDDAAAAELVARRAIAVVHGEEGIDRMVAAARSAGCRAAVALEVDTGMRRMGVPCEAACDVAARITEASELEFAHVFTHFACADEPDLAFSLAQAERFRDTVAALRQRRLAPAAIHAANSAGLLAPALVEALPEATAVRPGLMLYGARPAAHLGDDLVPVMTLRAPVVAIHTLRAGEGVGYGHAWRAPAATRVATVALGYADGLARAAGGRGEVWLGGARRPLRGRVSMDSCAVEIGDAPVGCGDEAVFFGAAAGAPRVEESADAAGTLAYEVLVRVGRRVQREYP